MKQIFRSKRGIKVSEVPLPTLSENEILISVEASVISTGTETTGLRQSETTILKKAEEMKRLLNKAIQKIKADGIEQTLSTIRQKLTPSEQSLVFNPIGYSNAGIIIAKGRLVNGFNVGDRVACAGSGIAAHAEFVTIPVNLAVKIPENLPFESAAFTTIGSIALQGIRRSEVTFGETIVITGLGLLGLIGVQIAKAWGLVVIGLDINVKRMELAKSLGADYCLKADDPDCEKIVQELTLGNGADAVIIYAATKSSEAANQALRLCRRKGRVVVVGAIGMDLQRDAMYLKELDFVISTSYGPGRYDNQYEINGVDYPFGYVRWTENRNMLECIRLMSEGKIKIQPLISNIYSIDQVSEAYSSLIDDPGSNIASLFLYHHEENEIVPNRTELHPTQIKSAKIKVGIIGGGAFVQNTHLPNLLKLRDMFELVAVANRTPAGSKTVGEKFKAQYITTDYLQILNDPNIDLVIIGTRHNLHAKQVVEAIKGGKHVLVEKPLAMTEEELEMIRKAYFENPTLHVSVGFNRRYSPFVQKAKELLSKNPAQVFINYRLNAGPIPINSWVQNLEEGGGRIIGEVCHFIDLVNYLTASEVLSIHSICIPSNNKNIMAEDNLAITIKYENGSIAVISYVSIGSKLMGKERLEIFSGNQSLVIDDFKRMQIYSSGEIEELKNKMVDKGHFMELVEIAKLLKGERSLIMPFVHDLVSSELTLKVNQLLNEQNY